METVNDLKKLLDLNLKDLTFSASEQDLNAINQKSKKLNNAINICIKSDNHSGQMSTMGIKNENEIKFRNYYDYNSKITREKPTKPIGVNVKKNFLKKGDGLKRFNLNRQDNIFINEKTDIKYCDSSNRNDRKIVSFANEDMQEKIINKNLGEKESLENECPNINNIDQNNNEDIDNDLFIINTKDEIKTLEERIKNLLSLKNSITNFPKFYKCKHENNESLIKLSECISNLNDKLPVISNGNNVKVNNVLSPNEEQIKNQTIKYSNGVIQTNYPDGSKTFKFPNGQTEKIDANGDKFIEYPDGQQRIIRSNKKEEIRLADGTLYSIFPNGTERLQYVNGDVEIKTDTYTKRKFVNGKIITVYSNGYQEILYNDGRVKFKNDSGEVIFDQIP